MPTHLVCAQLLWRPSHSSAGSPSLSVLASRITVVHTKQISPVEQLAEQIAEQLAGVARASGTASGVALTRAGVPGSFTRSLFVALSFAVFGMVTSFERTKRILVFSNEYLFGTVITRAGRSHVHAGSGLGDWEDSHGTSYWLCCYVHYE